MRRPDTAPDDFVMMGYAGHEILVGKWDNWNGASFGVYVSDNHSIPLDNPGDAKVYLDRRSALALGYALISMAKGS